MNQIPESLLQAGAIITMPDGYRAVVGDAHFNGYLLWWFEAFGREHFLEAAQIVQDGPWFAVQDSDGRRIATIGPMEGDDENVWTSWQRFLSTDDGRAAAASIADLKTQAAAAKQ